MAVVWTRQDKFNPSKGFRRIHWGAQSKVLDTELTELQKILTNQTNALTKRVLSDGFVNKGALVYSAASSGTLTVPLDTIVVDGYIIALEDAMVITGILSSTVYLAMWEQEVAYGDTLYRDGNLSGGQVVADNGIYDTEVATETSHRFQTQVQLVTSNADVTKKYIPVATINGVGGVTDNRIQSVIPISSGGTGSSVLQPYDAIIAATNGTYTTLGAAIAAGKKNILVRNGIYNEPSTIAINTDTTRIRGESREGAIIRVAAGNDGVHIFANGCELSSITIDAQTNNAQAAVVIGDGQVAGSPNPAIGNRNKLSDCTLKGSANIFCLFVAGAATSAGAQTITYFNNNNLQDGNCVEDCYLYSSYSGDGFSFSLQKNGSFKNNRLYGSRLSFYMTRNSILADNMSVGSSGHGFFVAAPSWDNIISNNTVYNSAISAFKTANNLEHPVTGRNSLRNTFLGNTATNHLYASFEINDAENCSFVGNTSDTAGTHGIYMYNTNSCTFEANIVRNPNNTSVANRGSGFYLIQSVGNTIKGNTIEDIRVTAQMFLGIGDCETTDCSSNIIVGNTIRGANITRAIWTQSNFGTISLNTLTGGYYAGIRLDGASSCTIVGNTLRNNTNDANNAYGEIWLQNGASKNVIVGNNITSDAAKKAMNGILIDSGCNNNIVATNSVVGSVGVPVSDGGISNTVVLYDGKGNIGIGINPIYGLHQLGGGHRLQALSTPGAPTVVPTGAAGTTSYIYFVVATDRNGNKTLASTGGTTATGNATLTGTNYNAISWVAVPGAVSYDVLKTNTATSLALGVTGLSVNDTGQATAVYTAPTRNATADMTIDGAVTIGSGSNAALVVAKVQEALLATTAATNVLSYTPTAQGNFSVKIYVRVITNPTNVTINLTYNDAGGAQTYAVMPVTSLAAGSHSINIPYFFNAVAGTPITITVTAGTASQAYVSASITGE